MVWVFAEVYVRWRHVAWRGPVGRAGRITSLGVQPRLTFCGALALLVIAQVLPSGSAKAPTAPSPKAQLMLLAPDIERHLRGFMAATGFHHRVKPNAPLPDAVRAITETWALSETFQESVRDFWDVRERISHGYDVPEAEVLRAIDSGKLILKTLEALRRPKEVVAKTGVELFSDHEGGTPRVGVWGLLLEHTSSDGKETKSIQVFPTTRTDYRLGDEVTWDFDMRHIYGETWYRDPETREIKHAWQGSAEFIGRPLADVNTSRR